MPHQRYDDQDELDDQDEIDQADRDDGEWDEDETDDRGTFDTDDQGRPGLPPSRLGLASVALALVPALVTVGIQVSGPSRGGVAHLAGAAMAALGLLLGLGGLRQKGHGRLYALVGTLANAALLAMILLR